VALLMCLCQDFRKVLDVHDGRTNLFLRYPSRANEAGDVCTLSQVHEGFDKEIQQG
jgi:hypothetical protein